MCTDSELESLARRVGEGLLRRNALLSTAESCTGGWIAKVCTDVAGSSRWFDRGLVTYSNQAKQELLAVPGSLIQTHGAVSEPVVWAMARAACAGRGGGFSVAVSGIAGPAGGTPEKPVGLVWFAWGHPAGVKSEVRRFTGDREAVRRQTVEMALRGLLAFIYPS